MTQDKKDFIETMLTWFRSPQVGNDEEFDRKFLASAYDNITQPHWISVEDELPKDGDCVLICNNRGLMTTSLYEGKEWVISETYLAVNVTHWMPLPQAPKKGE